jgi:hypothetical protein
MPFDQQSERPIVEDISELLTAARRAVADDESPAYRPPLLAMIQRDAACAGISAEQRSEADALVALLKAKIGP